MKVIFLDIDGVLNIDSDRTISVEKIKLLSTIIKQTGAEVVLSSSWRYGWNDPTQNVEGKRVYNTKKLLKEYDIVIDKTIGLDLTKDIQISNYLRANNPTSFVVIDDEIINTPNFIHINGSVGITEKNFIDAISILNTTL